MLYMVYMMCKNNNKGAISVYNAENKEVCKDIKYMYNTVDKTISCKYDIWVETLQMAMRKLQDMQRQRIITSNDTVRILIPVKVLYLWLCGHQRKMPLHYLDVITEIVDMMANFACTVELIYTQDSMRNNRAVGLLQNDIDNYTSVLSDMGE